MLSYLQKKILSFLLIFTLSAAPLHAENDHNLTDAQLHAVMGIITNFILNSATPKELAFQKIEAYAQSDGNTTAPSMLIYQQVEVQEVSSRVLNVLNSTIALLGTTDVNTPSKIQAIVDTILATPPQLTLIGDANITVELESTYVEEGASAIDVLDGNLTSKIIITGSVDTHMVGTYTIVYTVTDDDNNTATLNRELKVKDSTSPIFTSESNATVVENQTSAITLVATDASSVTYSISGGESSHFDINATTGVVTFKIAPDFETLATYTFIAHAVDTAANESTQNITIYISDVADVVPTLSVFTGSIEENATVGTEVGTVTITDSGDSAITAFTLSDSTNFEINASGIIKSKTTLDYETTIGYNLTVTATNTAGDSSAVNVTINVTDIADVVPTLSAFNGSIEENATVGTEVGTVTITDIGDSAITVFVLSGVGNENFEVSVSGVVTVKAGASLDYETIKSYQLTAVATNDAGNSTSVDVNISILNVIDNVPVLKTPSDTSIAEEAVVGTIVSTIELNGANSDENVTTSFSIVSGDANGDFSIDVNGEIVTAKILDYATTSSYTLGITATNAAGESSVVYQVVDVIKTNTPPTASDFNMTLDVNESTVIADWNVSANAHDVDGDELSATVTTQGTYGSCVVTDNSLAYLKTVETNTTDSCTLEVSDGSASVEVNVTIRSLYWKQISAGDYHTVAIKSNGTLWAWGLNGNGQLGDGTTTYRSTPTQESSASAEWCQVSAGYAHTVAVKKDGTLWVWGYNGSGQLGDGSTTRKLIPTQENSASMEWNQASAGHYHTVATKSNGTLWAWGLNNYGQLGDGTTSNRLVPTQEDSISTEWSQVSTGDYHTVATKSDGTLWAWGYNNVGQLGDSTRTNKTIPIQESTSAEDWSAISAGSYHTVALKNNGTLWGWGDNTYGQLGDGSTTANSNPIQEITNAEDWSAISAGSYHTVALKSNGTLWAWGYNSHGQLGDGSMINNSSPIQESTRTEDWSAISAGSSHTVALKSNGTLWAWGDNRYGQLGDGTIINHNIPQQENSKDILWSIISAGSLHTVALKNNGTLWAWGRNDYGQLGNNSTTNSSSSLIQEITGAEDWSVVSAGNGQTMALKNNGTLWVWGRNDYGQLGDGSTTNSSSPIQEITGAEDWSVISAGDLHTVALKSNGTLWAWGRNDYGQLGDGSTTNSSSPIQEITGAEDWSDISAGAYHTVALKSNGTLWAWGYNRFGELGDGSTIDSSNPIQEITGVEDWSGISAGAYHTVALKSNGSLWAWGYNKYGRLGDGSTTDSSSPVQESTGAKDWSVVSAGSSHTVALKSNGTLWAWGCNGDGQLGDGSGTNSTTPVQESSSSENWSAISTGSHTVALKNNGTLWAWGYNRYGQLGTDRIFPERTIKRK